MKKEIKDELERAYEASKTYKYKAEDWMTKEWEEVKISQKFGLVKNTGVDIAVL
jgi:hypothetical protein